MSTEAEKDIKKIKSKLKSYIPKNKSDMFRLSLSLFIAGMFFGIIEILTKVDSFAITIITSICMISAIFCFPYADKTKIMDGIANFLSYMGYTFITALATIYWLADLSNEEITIWLSIVTSILLVIFFYITFSPLFKVISMIVNTIKTNAAKNHNGSIITMFKCFFTGAGIVTAFLIALLTIAKTALEIFEMIPKS